MISGFKVIREGMDSSVLKASQDRNYITSSGHSRKSNFHATKTHINSSPLANSGSVPLLDLSKMFPTCLVLLFWVFEDVSNGEPPPSTCHHRANNSEHKTAPSSPIEVGDHGRYGSLDIC